VKRAASDSGQAAPEAAVAPSVPAGVSLRLVTDVRGDGRFSGSLARDGGQPEPFDGIVQFMITLRRLVAAPPNREPTTS
jgi:hypothetical protein